MSDNDRLRELRSLASKMDVLYVEDNAGMREQASQLFRKFFRKVHEAANGEEGLALFKKRRTKIVITDIRMPKMDGLEMAKAIRAIAPHTKIIVTTAFDDSEYLLESINIGIFRYLKKPINIKQIAEVLLDGLKQIAAEEDEQLFQFYVKNIFQHQKNLLVLYQKRKPVIVNDAFLEFFKVDDLGSFDYKFGSLGKHFLPHKNFLYNHDNVNWFTEAVSNTGRLHHVKMHDRNDQLHHFIFKIIPIGDKEGYFLISMDDITELGLLKLFDERRTQSDRAEQDTFALIRLLETAKRNQAEIRMQNLYKGVTIINKGLINTANKEKIAVQSTFLQQKAAQVEGQLLLSSELFPADILCQKVTKVDFEQQTIDVADLKFISSSPTQRQSVRLEPESSHTASLFYQEHKFGDGVRIKDISLEAVKISLLSLPAGFKADEPVVIDMVFTVMKRPVIINCKGTVFSITPERREFDVVVMLELTDKTRKLLVDYLSKRQMALIREFKGLKYG